MLNSGVQFEFRSDDSILISDQSVPVVFVSNPKARRYILRIKSDGRARVTIPRRGSLPTAREFLQRHTHWLAQQLQRLAAASPVDRAWRVGTEILFKGESVKITAGPDADSVMLADQVIRRTSAVQDVRPTIERHLRSMAAAEFPSRVQQFAQQHGLTVQRVTIRNQRSRWGSCSRRGTLSLNWRLIQMPPFVSDYIMLHELMHLRQMNHSLKFWREVEGVCPDFRKADAG